MAERLNRTIFERVRAMLHASELPKFLWAEAARHAVYLKNRTSTRALENTTPYEKLHKKKPNLANLPEWGAKVWVHDTSGSKLDARSRTGRWVGFEEASHAHRIYWPEKHNVTVERSIKFDVNDVQITSDVPIEGERRADNRPDANSNPDHAQAPTTKPLEAPSKSDTIPVMIPLVPDPLGPNFETSPNEDSGRGKRVRKPSEYIQRLRKGEGSTSGKQNQSVLPRGMREEEDDETAGVALTAQEVIEIGAIESAMAAEAADIEAIEPTYEEAKARPDWPRWREAIKTELICLNDAGTWTIVERPKGANIVDSKWVLRIKKNELGQIEKYKARLVAKDLPRFSGRITSRPSRPLPDSHRFEQSSRSRRETTGQSTPSIFTVHI
jgi:hypothetical protein